MKNNYCRKITLYCPLCGSDMFDKINAKQYTCIKCGTNFSKEEIMEENQYIINENVNDVKNEIIKDFTKELKNKLKGIMNIKWKL